MTRIFRLLAPCVALFGIAMMWTGAVVAQQPAPQLPSPNEVQSKIESTIGSLFVQNAQLSSQVMAAAGQLATARKQVQDADKQLTALKKQLGDANDQISKLRQQLATAQAKSSAPQQAPPKAPSTGELK